MLTIPESLQNGLFPVAAIPLLGFLSLPVFLLLVWPIAIGIRIAGCFDFFHAIPQNALLYINFTFRQGTFSDVVVQTSYFTDWYFFVELEKGDSWHHATKPARSHHVLTAFFDAGLERQLSLNISRALLFDFVFFCKLFPRFEREIYYNSLAPNLNMTAPKAEANH